MPAIFGRALEGVATPVAGVVVGGAGTLVSPRFVDPNDPSDPAPPAIRAMYYAGVRIRLTNGVFGTITWRAFGNTGVTIGDFEIHRSDFVFTANEGLSDVLEGVVPMYAAFSARVIADTPGMDIEVVPVGFAGDIVRFTP